MIDPRDQIRMILFDAFSECNSLCKQDMSSPAGQRSSRVSIRRIELCLSQLEGLSIKMREFIKESEGGGL